MTYRNSVMMIKNRKQYSAVGLDFFTLFYKQFEKHRIFLNNNRTNIITFLSFF